MRSADLSPTTARDELVVLVHGLAAHRLMLMPLARSLRRRGYQTLNWGYSSIRGEIRSLSERLTDQLVEIQSRMDVRRFHLVTHSMGSILARTAMSNFDFTGLGRAVMLGPPHAGSRVARYLSYGLGWLCKPLRQLSDRPGSFVNQLPEPDNVDIGIIAAAYDRVVHVDSTSLGVQKDHIVVNSGHVRMLFRADVADLVAGFLQCGTFAPGGAAEQTSRLPVPSLEKV